VNGVLFTISIAVFLWILIHGNSVQGHPGPPPGLPPPPGHGPPPPPGHGPLPPGHGHGPPPPPPCPPLSQDSRRAQWIPGVYPQPRCYKFWLKHKLPTSWFPATIFEFILFGMAVYKAIVSSSAKVHINGRRSLTAILLSENIVYFFLQVFYITLTNACMRY